MSSMSDRAVTVRSWSRICSPNQVRKSPDTAVLYSRHVQMSAEAAVDLARIGGRPRRHFLAIDQESPDELRELIDLALQLKRERLTGKAERPLAGRVLAMIFEHPSLRTRVSFEVAMLHLGGAALYIGPDEVGLGKRESVPDVARVLSKYVDAIMIRTSGHEEWEER